MVPAQSKILKNYSIDHQRQKIESGSKLGESLGLKEIKPNGGNIVGMMTLRVSALSPRNQDLPVKNIINLPKKFMTEIMIQDQ